SSDKFLASCGLPSKSCAHSSNPAPGAEGLAGYLAVIEIVTDTLDFLIRLVPLSGNQHHVAGGSPIHGVADGFPPIHQGDGPLPHLSVKPFLHVGDNRLGIFGAGIVRSEDDHIAVLRGDSGHPGTLAPVPVPAASHDAVYGSAGEAANRLEHILQTVR